MRLIDADALKEMVDKINDTDYGSIFDYTAHREVRNVLRDIKRLIDNMPTIEVEPVVRCEDCKHHCASDSYTGEKHDFHLFYKFNKLTKNKDFCSYGERKKEDV